VANDGNGYRVEGERANGDNGFDVSHKITVNNKALFGIKMADNCQCCYGHWGDDNGSGSPYHKFFL